MKGKIKVYRLERKGLGPFSQRTVTDEEMLCSAARADTVKFKKGDNHRCFLYATESPDKLKDYFREAYYPLIDEGFIVKEYLVPKRRIRHSSFGYELAFHAGTTDAAFIFDVRKLIA